MVKSPLSISTTTLTKRKQFKQEKGHGIMGYSKENVRWHSDHGPSRPAVNVKHWPDFDRDVPWTEFEPDFKEWVLTVMEIAERSGDYTAWEIAAESCWEQVQVDAEEIFETDRIKVWSQGRMGGWAVVDGLPDFDSWDAIMLNKWRKFERWRRQTLRTWLTRW
jgi:hypothetical protein